MFRRLDSKTGTVRWETNARGNVSAQYFFHGDVFVAPDRIIASADVDPTAGFQAGVHAFDRNSGRQLWMHEAGRGVLGAIVGFDKRVVAYAANGDLVALNVETGKPEWSYPLKAAAWESPGTVGLRVFAGSNDGSVYAFNGDTGQVEWQQHLGAAINTSVRAVESAVYAGTGDGVMHRLATGTGERLSSLKVDPVLKPATAPLVTRDAVIVLLADQGANYRGLVSLDPALGRINWRLTPPDRWSTTRIFATERAVLLGTPSGEVIAYCVADGSSAWSLKLSNAPIRAIGGSDEIIFAGTPQGTLYAIRVARSCM
jgi:eukaryotic-like serine/threonine-protein kinase